jgi:ribonuclease P protein component
MSFFSFRKDEILRRKKLIDLLFAEGNSFFVYPFKILWLPVALDSGFPVQILINVTKRAFRHAVDRNRIKRQIRELYRLNKHELYEQLDRSHQQGVLAIVYTARVHLPHEEMETKIKAALKRLLKEIDNTLNNPAPSLSE